jgi:CRP-like cAMP-binding protein
MTKANNIDLHFDLPEEEKGTDENDKKNHLKEILNVNRHEGRRNKFNESTSIEMENLHIQKVLLKFEYGIHPEVKQNPNKSIVFKSRPSKKEQIKVNNTKRNSYSDILKSEATYYKNILNNEDRRKSSLYNIESQLNNFQENLNKKIFRNYSKNQEEWEQANETVEPPSNTPTAQEKVTKSIERYSTMSRNRKFTFKQEIYQKISKNTELAKPLLTDYASNNSRGTLRPRKLTLSSKKVSYLKNDNRTLLRMNKICSNSDNSEEEDIKFNSYESKRWIIYHNSPFKRAFDIFIGFLTIYSIIVSPLLLAYPSFKYFPLLIFELFVDGFYMFDCISNFFVPYFDNEDNLITNHKLIAWEYLKSWFIPDIIACIPYGSILTLTTPDHHADISKFQRLTKISRIFKIAKIFKPKIFGLRKKKLPVAKSIRYFSLFTFGFCFISHVLACTWIYIAQLEYPNWISEYKYNDCTKLELYINSLYYIWATLFTVGYGDVTPKNAEERLFALFLMTFGLIGYAFALSTISNIITSNDTITQNFLDNINDLKELKKNHNMPESLYTKIAKSLNYSFKYNKNEKYEFIQDLPVNLKNSLINEMYNDFIHNFKFLQYEDDNFRSKVIMLLRPATFSKFEYIVYENEYIEEFMLVRHGYLKVVLGKGYSEKLIMKICKFEHFGDILIFSNQRSPVNIKVGSKGVELFFINKHDLLAISVEFPEIFDKITLVSIYNYLVMLEVTQKKMELFEKEKCRHRQFSKNNFSHNASMLSSLPSSFIQPQMSQEIEGSNNFLLSSKDSMIINQFDTVRPFNEVSNQDSINAFKESSSEGGKITKEEISKIFEDLNLDNNVKDVGDNVELPRNVNNFLQTEILQFTEEKIKTIANLQDVKFNKICKSIFNEISSKLQ